MRELPLHPVGTTRVAHRTCPICDAVCGLRLTLDDDDRVTSVRGDTEDPFSRGYLCPKGASLGALDGDPDRLRHPLVRDGDTWTEVSWDEAFRRVEDGLGRVLAEHGRDAAAVYFGNSTFHTMAGFVYRQPLTQTLATRNTFSAATIDQMPKHVAAGSMYGDAMAFAVPDVDRTDHLLVIGANPLESHGSLCAAPDFRSRLTALRERGGRIVVVDPRRTRTAEFADQHVRVRPGTDAVLLLAVLHVLFAEDLVSGTGGFTFPVAGADRLRELATGFPPALAERVCGVPADVVAGLARELATARTAAVYTRIGTSTAEFGTLTQWLVDVLNIVTGNMDREGGVMFTRTAALEVFRSPEPFTTGRWHSRVRGLPEVMGELPVATLADEILTPGAERVRAFICIGGNLALSAPGGPRLAGALDELDFMVAVDPYLNETTRHAHVILPPPRIVQSAHYDFLMQTVTVRNYTRFSPQIVPLGPDQRSEAEILARLTLIAAGAGAQADPAGLDEQIVGQILAAGAAIPGSPFEGQDVARLAADLDGADGPERLLDAMLRLGPHGLSLARLLEQPHGIDLGPLEPRLKELITTPSGCVELAPDVVVADLERLRRRLDEPVPDILLVGRRQLRSNNSWLHNVPGLRGGSNGCTLHVHPDDAARLGLGERALLRSAAGELEVPVETTDAVMPGVVSLPHGWGHRGGRQTVAEADPGVNANTVTDESVLDALSGTAVFNGVPVEVVPLPS